MKYSGPNVRAHYLSALVLSCLSKAFFVWSLYSAFYECNALRIFEGAKDIGDYSKPIYLLLLSAFFFQYKIECQKTFEYLQEAYRKWSTNDWRLKNE